MFDLAPQNPEAEGMKCRDNGRPVLPFTKDFTLSFISLAALLVKVTARTDPALTPVCIRYAVLMVMTLVFPEPAPARMRRGPSICTTASFCLGLRRAISLYISICME